MLSWLFSIGVDENYRRTWIGSGLTSCLRIVIFLRQTACQPLPDVSSEGKQAVTAWIKPAVKWLPTGSSVSRTGVHISWVAGPWTPRHDGCSDPAAARRRGRRWAPRPNSSDIWRRLSVGEPGVSPVPGCGPTVRWTVPNTATQVLSS